MKLQRTFHLILAAAWLAVSAWSQNLVLAPNPDLVDSTNSSLLVEGSPLLSQGSPKVLNFNIPGNSYFAVYDSKGYIDKYGNCQLPNGAMLALAGSVNNVSVSVVQSGGSGTPSAITTTASNINFTIATGDVGYANNAFAAIGDAPTTFNLTGVTAANCSVNNSPLLTHNYTFQLTEYIKITSAVPQPGAAVPAIHGLDGGGDVGDGGWVPIAGNSLKFLAPVDASGKQFYFNCTGDYSAELSGLKVVRLEDVGRTTNEPFLYLNKIYDWDITAYPENVQIAPNGDKLTFTASAPFKFQCKPNANPTNLIVVIDKKPAGSGQTSKIPRPQELVVSWRTPWSLWFARRYMTVPCGDRLGIPCTLQLVTSK